MFKYRPVRLTLLAGLTTVALMSPTPLANAAIPVCNGSNVAPTLTRDQFGAYIFHGVKYFCSNPVSFDLTTTLYQEFEDGGIAVEPGARNMGVNKEPYVYDTTLACRTLQPTQYYAIVDGTLEGTTDPDVSFKTATVTLECSF